MSFGEVFPIVVVVSFWLAAFVFAWVFTARALRAPIEYEEAHAVEAQNTDSHSRVTH
jgi:hypothetical protein